MIRSNSKRFALALVGLALVAAACTSTSSDSDGANETTTSTVVETTAVLDTTTTEAPVETGFEETECQLNIDPEIEVTCGNLEVPANWDTGEGSFSLEIAVLRSTSDSPAEPVFYLEGGPGGHALETLEFTIEDLFRPLTARGDVVVFDQRGAGQSGPAASCPELDELEDSEAGTPDKLAAEDAALAALDALTECGERLRGEGVAIDDLNTTNNARDVDAIRQALEYDRINLLGISYGTRLGLEVMRLFPETLRSVVLDSVFPHPVDAAAEQTQAFADSFDAVVAACAAEPECAAQGDLGARVEAAVAKLEETPMEVDIVNFQDGSTSTVFIDGDALVGIINASLYGPASFTDFPELMTGIETDDPTALSLFASVIEANGDFLTAGMFLAVACADEFAFSDPATVLEALPEDRFGLVPPELAANAQFDQCNAFSGVQSDPVADEPVNSDVQTLILAGQFDPATPVAWAQVAAQTLPNSQLIIFPGESHGIAPTKCGLEVVEAFFAEPDVPVDPGCAEDSMPVFVAAASTPITDFETLDVDIGGIPASVVVPADWTHSGDGFVSDARRGQSLLDSAELLQFAGDPAVVTSIDTTLESQFGGAFASAGEREIGGNTWEVSAFAVGDLSVTSLKTERDSSTIVLYLFSTPTEHESLVETVLTEAAAGFTLS